MIIRVSLLAGLALLAPATTAQAMSGGACAASIATFKRAVEGDTKTGNMHQSVYKRVKPEIDRAEAVCASGRGAEAVRMINATKGRYGYN
jgi:hypothetical protein